MKYCGAIVCGGYEKVDSDPCIAHEFSGR